MRDVSIIAQVYPTTEKQLSDHLKVRLLGAYRIRNADAYLDGWMLSIRSTI